ISSQTPEEILRDEARCSICLEIFQDPVSIHCGHSFCQSCISRTWEGLTTNFSCPQCRKTRSRKSLRRNRELANMIEATKSLNLQPVKEVEGGKNLCEEHQEPLKLFCKDEGRLICVVCDRSKVHHNHSVVPVGEAAQEYKVRGLWASVKQEILTTYRKLHEFLEKQESSLLAQLEQLDTEIMNVHEEILHRLLEETTSLGTLTGEMERMYQQPDLELLKVRGRAFQTWDAWRGPNRIRGVGRERKSLVPPKSAAMSLTFSPPPAQMTLDPQTANASLYLSEDCKFVRWEIHEQNLPSNPERFKVDPCVLGSRGFTLGLHCWDVEISRDGVWAIGVAKESVPRERLLHLKPEVGVWALCHNRDGYMAHTSPVVTPLTLRSDPKQIRVCLDCEEGRVVFFNAESNERIFAFPQVSFQGERVFPWFMVRGNAQIKILS
uniref:Uncharacterized protein n=1 Tax=Calidris pygmaea TaxID=425635 RepID=A0A8C3KLY1_9CHAR